METNEILGEQILEIVENQISGNDPLETKITLERLIKIGYSELDAKKLIGQCVVVELFNIFKLHETFNEKRYVQNLTNLPIEPFDDEE